MAQVSYTSLRWRKGVIINSSWGSMILRRALPGAELSSTGRRVAPPPHLAPTSRTGEGALPFQGTLGIGESVTEQGNKLSGASSAQQLR